MNAHPVHSSTPTVYSPMPKPNFSFEKRRKELEKKAKKEEKKKRKLDGGEKTGDDVKPEEGTSGV